MGSAQPGFDPTNPPRLPALADLAMAEGFGPPRGFKEREEREERRERRGKRGERKEKERKESGSHSAMWMSYQQLTVILTSFVITILVTIWAKMGYDSKL